MKHQDRLEVTELVLTSYWMLAGTVLMLQQTTWWAKYMCVEQWHRKVWHPCWLSLSAEGFQVHMPRPGRAKWGPSEPERDFEAAGQDKPSVNYIFHEEKLVIDQPLAKLLRCNWCWKKHPLPTSLHQFHYCETGYTMSQNPQHLNGL